MNTDTAGLRALAGPECGSVAETVCGEYRKYVPPAGGGAAETFTQEEELYGNRMYTC